MPSHRTRILNAALLCSALAAFGAPAAQAAPTHHHARPKHRTHRKHHPRHTRRHVSAQPGKNVVGMPPAPLPAGSRCQPAGATILADDGYARVYGQAGAAYVCISQTGQSSQLTGASPSADRFALGGQYVAYSSGPAHSIVNVMRIPDHAVSNSYPFDTNDHVDGLVVEPDGAAAWAATSSDPRTYVQGFDRSNHPPDQFSDDLRTVVGSSLHPTAGQAIAWSYSDGSTGTATLY